MQFIYRNCLCMPWNFFGGGLILIYYPHELFFREYWMCPFYFSALNLYDEMFGKDAHANEQILDRYSRSEVPPNGSECSDQNQTTGVSSRTSSDSRHRNRFTLEFSAAIAAGTVWWAHGVVEAIWTWEGFSQGNFYLGDKELQKETAL